MRKATRVDLSVTRSPTQKRVLPIRGQVLGNDPASSGSQPVGRFSHRMHKALVYVNKPYRSYIHACIPQ